jgi:hypothetical protein
MPAKHLEWSIRSVAWHGPVVTPDTHRPNPYDLAWDGCLCARAGPYPLASLIRRLSLLLKGFLSSRPERRRARQEVVEMRRIAVVIVLVLAAGWWPATQALALGRRPCRRPGRALQADFNNDGDSDLGLGDRSRPSVPLAQAAPEQPEQCEARSSADLLGVTYLARNPAEGGRRAADDPSEGWEGC